jgi:2-dehydro-3-deoxyphosphooctonate aldolase (KDO 8-P synthase)
MSFSSGQEIFQTLEKSFFCVLGPCVIENEELTFNIAEELQKITSDLEIPFVFKASFDKANRTSLQSYRGPGIEKGLDILKQIKTRLGIPVLTDIHEPWQAELAAKSVSILQVPAFLCRQTDLLIAAGRTQLPVNIKKGQFMTAENMQYAIDKISSTNNSRILLTERGSSFGYNNLVVDFRNIGIMKQLGFPVIIDATHSVQKPPDKDSVSGGTPQFIPLIASCGIVSGANGIFLEVHPDPISALSDGTNMLELKMVSPLLIKLKSLYNIDS